MCFSVKPIFRISTALILGSVMSLHGLCAAVTPWQPPAPIPLQHEGREERVDAMDTYWVELFGPEFKARWFSGGDWFVSRDDFGASLSFVQRVDRGLQMRLYLYPASGALPDFEESSLLAYAASMPAQFPGWKLADSKLAFDQSKLGGLPLLDVGYRKVGYQLVPENGVAEPLHVCDLLCLLEDGRFFVLRFVGSEAFIRATEADLDAEIRRFMLDS